MAEGISVNVTLIFSVQRYWASGARKRWCCFTINAKTPLLSFLIEVKTPN
ncbi:hypothetical protein ABLO16_18040 [Mycobacterium tuberculosis]